jgi:hypothetical protein
MWEKTKKCQEPGANLTGDRLATLLGLDLKEYESDASLSDDAQQPPDCLPSDSVTAAAASPEITACGQTSADAVEPAALDHSPVQMQSDFAGLEAMSAAIRSVAERVTREAGGALKGQLKPVGQQAASETSSKAETTLPGLTARVQHYPAPPDELHTIAENELADLSEKSKRLLEERARLFEERLVEIVNKTLSQSEANVHRTVSHLEACFARAKEIESSMGESLASLARQALEAVHVQTKTLEGELSKVAELIESQVTEGLEPVTSRIQDCRAQAEEINSTLQASLTRFTQEVAEAALAETQSFGEKIATISGQAANEAQSSLESRMSQLRDTAAYLFENEIRSLSERLQHSHLESLQIRLEETFEAFRAKLQGIQQESGNFSADLLRQMRTASDALVRDVHERLQSDAQSVAANMVVMMQSRLQKLTGEFRALFDGPFA